MDVLITILTIIVYLLANSFSYKIGTSMIYQNPLYDILHEILPNLSKHVHIRDYLLISMILPILFMKKLWPYIPELWNIFMVVILIKAICIFFTYIPSSHQSCQNPTILDLNHCHHCAVSGHSALSVILALLYIKGGFNAWIICICVFFYSLLIIASRAHYTDNVIQGILFTLIVAT
jgi:hypothetical protein